jgi:hypothetical protein
MKELTITVDDDVYDVLHPMVKDQTIGDYMRVQTFGGIIYPSEKDHQELMAHIRRMEHEPPMFVGVDAEAIREL